MIPEYQVGPGYSRATHCVQPADIFLKSEGKVCTKGFERTETSFMSLYESLGYDESSNIS